MGQGLQRILKIYGRMKVTDSKGKSVIHVWDYKNNKPRLESEMSKEEISESEKEKWRQVKCGI